MEPLRVECLDEVKWMEVTGLGSIHRSGDATIIHEGSDVILKANLGFTDLKGSAAFEKQLWWLFWISGEGHANIHGLNIYGELRVNLFSQAKPVLEELIVTDWGQVEAVIDGGNWIGEIVEFFTGLFPSILTNYLKSNLPGVVKDGINDVLAEVDFGFGKF